MANLETLFIEIDGSAQKATSGIDNLIGKLGSFKSLISGATAEVKGFTTALREMNSATKEKTNWKSLIAPHGKQQEMKATASAMRSLANANNKYAQSMTQLDPRTATATTNTTSNAMTEAATETASQYASQMQDVGNSVSSATRDQQNYANATELSAQANAQLSNSTKQASKSMKEVGNSSKKTADEVQRSASAASGSSGLFKRLANSISGTFKQMTRIAKSMLIRTAIRSLFKGAKEGLENYYHYSKTIGNGFSDTMDQMAGSAAQAKNQLGAALASALMTLAPVLNALADAAIWCLNALTALFAALGGRSTYSKATKQTAEFAAETKKAGGAVKDLLADFDELNVIANQGGGGGGGASTPDYGSMFEEAEVPQWLQDLAPWLKWAAIFTGVALAAEKIWGWIKKIKDLFDKFKTPTMPTVPAEPNWSTFEQQLGRIRAEIQGINGDIATVTTVMQTLTSAVWVTVAAVGALALATKLVTSPKITADLDREDYDKWVSDLNDLTDDLKNNPRILTIRVVPDLTEYTKFIFQLGLWLAKKPVKTIDVVVNTAQYTTSVTMIEMWVNRLSKKYIDVGFDPVSWPTFWSNATSLDKWVGTVGVKLIAIRIEPITYGVFQGIAKSLNDWANQTLTKTINIVVKVKTSGTGSSGIASAIVNGVQNTGVAAKITENLAFDLVKNFGSGGGSSGNNTIDISSSTISPIPGFNRAVNDLTDIFTNGLSWENVGNLFEDLAGLLPGFADGAMGIPRGELFVAQEQGAELIGSINGKTSVANQEQIIAGISRGVENANAEQNALLRQQNELLRGILNKDASIRIGASAALGRVAKQSMDMYSKVGG